MSNIITWQDKCAEILFEELEWCTMNADVCSDEIEAGKYRHAAGKAAMILLELLRVRTMNRRPTAEESEALAAAANPSSSITHRLLLRCKWGLCDAAAAVPERICMAQNGQGLWPCEAGSVWRAWTQTDVTRRFSLLIIRP